MDSKKWVWVDLEMTGLNVETDIILEIAVIITDSQLNVIAEGPNIVLNASEEELNSMSNFVKDMHTRSGLFERCLQSTVTLEQATQTVQKFLDEQMIEAGILAGNSIHADRLFLRKYMRSLFDKSIHPVDILDVSTIKELSKAWYNLEAPKRTIDHRALSDIVQSIEELRFYKQNVFNNQPL